MPANALDLQSPNRCSADERGVSRTHLITLHGCSSLEFSPPQAQLRELRQGVVKIAEVPEDDAPPPQEARAVPVNVVRVMVRVLMATSLAHKRALLLATKAIFHEQLPSLQVEDRGYDTGAISPLMSPRNGDDGMVRTWLHRSAVLCMIIVSGPYPYFGTSAPSAIGASSQSSGLAQGARQPSLPALLTGRW